MRKKSEKTPEELVDDIQRACKELGWEIAMDVRNQEISGLVIGQREYIDNVLLGEDINIDNYEYYGYTEDNQQ